MHLVIITLGPDILQQDSSSGCFGVFASKFSDKDGSTPERSIQKIRKQLRLISWLSKVSSILSRMDLFVVKLATSVANSMARSSQPLILKSLGADESLMGTVMAVQFGFGGFACAFLLSPVTKLLVGHVSKLSKCVLVMGLYTLCKWFCIQNLSLMKYCKGWSRKTETIYSNCDVVGAFPV